MRLVPISDLIVPETRQRREFEAASLVALQESIERIGLMHPLVVRAGNILVAGERRLRAMRDLWALDTVFYCHNQLIPIGLVPCIDLGDLSPLEAMEAELDENLKRKDLTWQEIATAQSKLHNFRITQDPAHNLRDTAEEIAGTRVGGLAHDVRQNILLAAHLDNPIIAKAKDAGEAFKLLQKVESAAESAKLAAHVGRTFSAHDHSLLWGDCLSIMGGLPAASFDCILTDPPYGISADEFGDGAGKLTGITHEYVDSNTNFRALMEAAAVGFDRVCKRGAHLYCCCDLDGFFFLRDLLSRIGAWNVFRTPLINYKRGSGRVPLPEHGPRRQYELILYAYRGDKRVTGIYPDVLESSGDDNLGHGAQKPVSLFWDLLRRSTQPGDRVLDPFCGTGTIFPAAHSLKVAATGIEQEAAYYGIAVKRIEELK